MEYSVIIAALRNCKYKTSCDDCPVKQQCYSHGNFVEDFAADLIEKLVKELQTDIFANKCGTCKFAEPCKIGKSKSGATFINCRNPDKLLYWERIGRYRGLKARSNPACVNYERVEKERMKLSTDVI